MMDNDNMGSSSGSHYKVFLDNYNKGNTFLNDLTASFFEQITVDQNNIIKKDTGMLKDKFTHINALRQDKTKSNYEKTLIVGNLLSTIANDIIKADDPEVKKSGINIINSFLNIARETEDQQLLDTAMRLSNNISL